MENSYEQLNTSAPEKTFNPFENNKRRQAQGKFATFFQSKKFYQGTLMVTVFIALLLFFNIKYSTKVSEANKRRGELLNQKSESQARIHDINEELKKYQRNEKDANKENKEIEDNITELENENKALSESVQQSTPEYKALTDKITEIQLEIKNQQVVKEDLNNQFNQLTLKLNEIEQKIDKVNNNN